MNVIIMIFTDIDECATNRYICVNGDCHNTEGSYFCKCHSGYELSPDRTSCEGTNYSNTQRETYVNMFHSLYFITILVRFTIPSFVMADDKL